MAPNIALAIALAFIIFGALERLVPVAAKLFSTLSGFAFVLLAAWGVYLGSS